MSDGSTYRGSSLTSFHLQAKGSEYSFATRRRAPERNSPYKRQDVGVRNSSSGPCVLSLSIEPKIQMFTNHFRGDAKVIHSWLRKSKQLLSSPAVNNFGRTISAGCGVRNAEVSVKRECVVRTQICSARVRVSIFGASRLGSCSLSNWSRTWINLDKV